MNLSDSYKPARFPWYFRIALCGIGFTLLALLVIAAMLKPDPRGQGTHTQLGLPICTFEQLFGRGARCPSCGMTTSWAHMTKGEVIKSFQANSGGALLSLIAAVCGPWVLVSGLLGKWFVRRPNEALTVVVGLTVLLVTLVDWGIRLAT